MYFYVYFFPNSFNFNKNLQIEKIFDWVQVESKRCFDLSPLSISVILIPYCNKCSVVRILLLLLLSLLKNFSFFLSKGLSLHVNLSEKYGFILVQIMPQSFWNSLNCPSSSIAMEKLTCKTSIMACSYWPSPTMQEVLGWSLSPLVRVFCLHPPFFFWEFLSFITPSQPTPAQG